MKPRIFLLFLAVFAICNLSFNFCYAQRPILSIYVNGVKYENGSRYILTVKYGEPPKYLYIEGRISYYKDGTWSPDIPYRCKSWLVSPACITLTNTYNPAYDNAKEYLLNTCASNNSSNGIVSFQMWDGIANNLKGEWVPMTLNLLVLTDIFK